MRWFIVVVFSVTLCALFIAFWLHGRYGFEIPGSCEIFDPAKAGSVVASAVYKFSSSSALALTPTSITVSSATPSGAAFHSNGLVFDSPWANSPTEETSTPNAAWTFFNFGRSRIIEVFASGTSLSPIANNANQAFLDGFDEEHPGGSDLLKNCYGAAFNSNFGFIRASLDSSPADLATSTLSDAVLAATAFLPVKSTLIQYLSTDVLPIQHLEAIYSIQIPLAREFGFKGWFINGTTTYDVTHVLIFGPDDRSHDVLIEGATPVELRVFLSSLRTEPI